MTWTIEKPTRPGWYWYRNNEKDDQLLMDVRKIEAQLTAAWPNGLCDFIDSMPGEWSGPLESPVRPELDELPQVYVKK